MRLKGEVCGFAGRLAALLRGEAELGLVLGASEGIQLPSADFPLPRLRLALDAGLKDFVSVSGVHCQVGTGNGRGSGGGGLRVAGWEGGAGVGGRMAGFVAGLALRPAHDGLPPRRPRLHRHRGRLAPQLRLSQGQVSA